MPPESLDADPTSLPRQFRGYNRAATEELFRRVSWEYGVLAGEHRKLKKSLGEAPAAPAPPAVAAQPVVVQPVAAQPVAAEPVAAEPVAAPTPAVAPVQPVAPPPPRPVVVRAPRTDHDEIARAVLASALTAAREIRESARDEGERALKKAKGRAAEIEAEATRAAKDAVAVLEAAALLRANLRAALDNLERSGPIPGPTPGPTAEPSPASQQGWPQRQPTKDD